MTIELAEAYFNDRVNELLNADVKNGTPFVFISGLTILNVLNNIVKIAANQYDNKGYVIDGTKYPPMAGLVLTNVASGSCVVNLPGLSMAKTESTIFTQDLMPINKFLKEEYKAIDALLPTLNQMTNHFSLSSYGGHIKINLSHKNEEHLQAKLGKKGKVIVTLAAEPFLLDIKEAVGKLFNTFKQLDEPSKVKVVQALNTHPLIGYGG